MANFNPRMIIVSNRLPFIVNRRKDNKLVRGYSAGGLVTALGPVVIDSGGYWVGWAGSQLKEGDMIPPPQSDDTSPTASLPVDKISPVILDDNLMDNYYNGCCNATFWPLFHSMPARASFVEKYFQAYKEANEMFGIETAKLLMKIPLKEDETPVIWVHDYHLMLATDTIRNKASSKIKYKLSFFLHIPFPSWDIFKLLPWADEILQGILGSDLVCFHTFEQCLNFVDCCQRALGCRVDRNELLVEQGGRTVRVKPLPVGIPFTRFVSLAEAAPTVLPPQQITILAVDRLDFTKGLPQRLNAFELLLEKYPEYIGKVVLLQIAVPSRQEVKVYKDLKEEMDQLVGKINGKFATPNWSPIRYIYGQVPHEELASFYRDSQVAFIAPLRDGMNLVAKEYVACQIKHPPGVLILSPFAGASDSMHEALICNINEVNITAETLRRALTMPEDEKIVRMNLLRRREKVLDANHWARSFLKEIGNLVLEDGFDIIPQTLQPFTLKDFDEIFGLSQKPQHKLALLLDYDGTLAPIAPHPDLATLPKETKQLLQKLSNLPDVHISIVSGRDVNNLIKMVDLPNITYAGNHGLIIVHPDGNRFVFPMPKEYEDRAVNLLKSLQDQVSRDGAWVETKGVYMTWHYREVTDIEVRDHLMATAKKLISDQGFIPENAHHAIEAKPPIEWHKGRASLYILRMAFGLDWSDRIRIIYVGDDITDEYAMQTLQGIATTFRVVESKSLKTLADHRLPSTESVVTLLKWVEQYYSQGVGSMLSNENSNQSFNLREVKQFKDVKKD